MGEKGHRELEASGRPTESEDDDKEKD